MKKSMIMLMLAGLVIQPSLNAAGLFKRLKPRGIPFRGRKVQQTNVKLGVTPGQKTPGYVTSPVPRAGRSKITGNSWKVGQKSSRIETLVPERGGKVQMQMSQKQQYAPGTLLTNKQVKGVTSLFQSQPGEGPSPTRRVGLSGHRLPVSKKIYREEKIFPQTGQAVVVPVRQPQVYKPGNISDKEVSRVMNLFQSPSSADRRVPLSRTSPLSPAVRKPVVPEPKPNTYAVPDAQVDRVMNLFRR